MSQQVGALTTACPVAYWVVSVQARPAQRSQQSAVELGVPVGSRSVNSHPLDVGFGDVSWLMEERFVKPHCMSD